ncbi:hypothetical protein M9H77_21503 [Catharanthus roseus]|uniref:Uncharacterized protein n=1 Tax=Catharanthus roseus TaxID=4058 RepID=A0ACC0APK0_CATRO|nr:hypothetical protein M9H77_21503 [Catharanthus roseus]
MRMPMHAIVALSSLLQETSSNFLATLINDVLDLSRLEDGSLQLDIATFNLHSLFSEVFVSVLVLNLIKPIASEKRLFATLSLVPDTPEYAIGDEKWLMQIMLNVVGNAVKFTKEGGISITAFVAKSDSLRDPIAPEFFPVPSDRIKPQDIPKLFTKCPQRQTLATRNSGGSLTSWEGKIWLESDGLGKGCTAIFMIKAWYSWALNCCLDRPLIIALTTNTNRVMKDNCLRVGIDGVIQNPISVHKMISVLSEVLDHGVLLEAQ